MLVNNNNNNNNNKLYLHDHNKVLVSPSQNGDRFQNMNYLA